MATPIQNPFDQQAIDKLEEAVDLSRALIDNANELNRIYKKAGTTIQDSFVKSTKSLAKTLNEMSTQIGKMSLNEFKRSDAAKLQKKLTQDITKLEQEKARIEQNTLPVRQQQADIAKRLKLSAEADFRTAKATYGVDSMQASLAKRRLDVVTRANDRAQEKLRIEEDAVRTAQELIVASQEENDKIEQYVKNWDKANLKVGLAGRLLKGMGKIPIVGDVMNANKGLEAMQKGALEGKNSFKVMGEGISAAFQGIEKSTVILAIISAVVKAMQLLKDIMFQVDKQVTDIARNLSISKDEAQITRKYYAEISHSVESQYKSTEDIIQAQKQLNELTSLSVMSSKALLDNQLMLTKELGLSDQEAAQLNSTFATNTEEGKKSLDIIYDQIAAYGNQTKVLFNGRRILKEMSQVSGQILASFKGSTAALANAVMRVDKLGLSLEKAKNISESMLEFESSIQAQMEAEVLTGKTLNLDKARLLALQGDYAGVAEEITREAGDFDKFSKMNVIQQQAIAKAVGMTADDLADSLRKQKFITGEAKAQIERLKEAGNIERANAIERGILQGQTLKDAEKSVDAEEKFNQAIKEAKEIFSNLVSSGTLDKLVDTFKQVVEFLAASKKFGELLGASIEFMIAPLTYVGDFFKSIAQIINGDIATGIKNLGLSIVKLVLSPFKQIASVLDFVLGTKMAKSLDIGPAFEETKENKTVNAKDFTINTLPEDTIQIAGGTKLGRTDEMVAELKQQNRLLAALLSKDQTISIDGQRVANVVAKNVPTTYGNLLNPGANAFT